MTDSEKPALPATATGMPLPKDVLGKSLAKEIAAERRLVLKNIGKAATSMVQVGLSLQRVNERLKPFGSKMFTVYLNSLGISRSHAYQLMRLAARFGDLPSLLAERFCGTSMLLLANRGNDQAVTEALQLAEGGERISVASAKAIVAKHKSPSERKSSIAIKIPAGEIATIVLHPKANADVAPLSAAIEQVIEQHLSHSNGGAS